MKLSIIIPVFNEEKTIAEILDRVNKVSIRDVQKELIIVNDGSTDATASEIKNQKSKIKNFRIITHSKNLGKGAAIRSGIKQASGDYILIQDADLEYDPKSYNKLISPILQKKSKVVYGTRLKRLPNLSKDERTLRFLLHYIGNKALSLLTSILYGQWITDMETGYKIFPKKAIMNMRINAKGFEFEPEITAKLLKSGFRIDEIPITTNPRGYKEGKKLQTVKDGLKALSTLIKYRFGD